MPQNQNEFLALPDNPGHCQCLSLPHELIEEIFSWLPSSRDKATLARVSKLFNWLITPSLYNTVTLYAANENTRRFYESISYNRDRAKEVKRLSFSTFSE